MPVEQISTDLERIVSSDAEVEQLASGLATDTWPAEGLVGVQGSARPGSGL